MFAYILVGIYGLSFPAWVIASLLKIEWLQSVFVFALALSSFALIAAFMTPYKTMERERDGFRTIAAQCVEEKKREVERIAYEKETLQ